MILTSMVMMTGQGSAQPIAAGDAEVRALYDAKIADVFNRSMHGATVFSREEKAARRGFVNQLSRNPYTPRMASQYLGQGIYMTIAASPIQPDGSSSALICVGDVLQAFNLFRAVTQPRGDGYQVAYGQVFLDAAGRQINLAEFVPGGPPCLHLIPQIGRKFDIPEAMLRRR